MNKENSRGKGGSYFRPSPDAERVLVAGTDQVPPSPAKPEDTKEPLEAPRPRVQATGKGAA